jgi:hypothetical protein
VSLIGGRFQVLSDINKTLSAGIAHLLDKRDPFRADAIRMEKPKGPMASHEKGSAFIMQTL